MRKSPIALAFCLALALLSTNCATVYDAQGRPQQVVTPEGAALAAVAAGVAGYAIGRNNGYYHRGYGRGCRY